MTLNRTPTQAPAVLADVTAQLAALTTLSSRELARRLTALTGRPSRTNNRDYLLRAVATVIQERAEPHPREGIARRVAELGDEVPLRWRMRGRPVEIVRAPPPPAAVATNEAPATRDPRLPPAGTELRRHYKGAEHEVLVGEEGFQYRGQRYRSLSHVARAITGRQWNGYAFFSLTVADDGAAR